VTQDYGAEDEAAQEEEAALLAAQQAEQERLDQEAAQAAQPGATPLPTNGDRAPRVPPPMPGATDVGNNRELFDYVMKFAGYYHGIDDPRRVKSLATQDRFGDQGRHEESLDNFLMELSARALGAGGDVDSYIAKGGLSRRWVPLSRRRVAQTNMHSFRSRLVVGTNTNPLSWEEVTSRLRELRDNAGQIELADGTTQTLTDEELATLDHFLEMDEDEALDYLGTQYGGIFRTLEWVNKWAQKKGEFNPNLAYRGKAGWELAPIKNDPNSHRYRLFQTMPNWWTDTFMYWYFNNHSLKDGPDGLRELCRLSKHDPDDNLFYARGYGRLRHYDLMEIWCPEGASPERRRQVRINRENWLKGWRLRYHYLHAYRLAFEFYVERFEHSQRAYRELEAYYGTFAPNATAPDQDVLSITNGVNPLGRLDDWYDKATNQVPPSIIYGVGWKRIEALSQFKRRLEEGEAPRGQRLEEVVEGFERELDVLSWIEYPFQVDSRGNRHDSWYARTDHDCQTTSKYWLWAKDPRPESLEVKTHSYCEECVKWENWKSIDQITEEDLAAEVEVTKVVDGQTVTVRQKLWVYREVNVEFATRQEEQEWRKIIGTHNRGSAMAGHYSRGNLTRNTVATNRDAYVGGFQEAIDGRAWYYAGIGVLTPLRDIVRVDGVWQIRRRDNTNIDWDDPSVTVEVADITHDGIVSRHFLLGPLADLVNTEEAEPYNNYWMEHFDALVDLQDSRKLFESVLGNNLSGEPYRTDDLSKDLEKLKAYNDGVVSPTSDGRANFFRTSDGKPVLGEDGKPILLGRNEFGRDWVDFQPEFDPHQPKLHRYGDMAFHIDPLWFEHRNFYSPVIIRELQHEYERVFGRKESWTANYEDGTRKEIFAEGGKTVFETEEFRLYLIAHTFNHQQLDEDFWWNQQTEKPLYYMELSLRHNLEEGQMSLRQKVYDKFKGLPPSFHAAEAQWLERADNRERHAWLIVLHGADGARRLEIKGQVISSLLHGHGQGYGPIEDQQRNIERALNIGYKAGFFDALRGFDESESIAIEALGPEEFVEEYQGWLRRRTLPLSYAYDAAKMFEVLGLLPGGAFINRWKGHHHELIEEWWELEIIREFGTGIEDENILLLQAIKERRLHGFPIDPQDIDTLKREMAPWIAHWREHRLEKTMARMKGNSH
jgi:hypothetical protein